MRRSLTILASTALALAVAAPAHAQDPVWNAGQCVAFGIFDVEPGDVGAGGTFGPMTFVFVTPTGDPRGDRHLAQGEPFDAWTTCGMPG